MLLRRAGILAGVLLIAALTLGGAAAPGAAKSVTHVEKKGGYTIQLLIDGQVSSFSDVSGLGMEMEVVEYREGGDTGTHEVHKLPGRTSYQSITLSRELGASDPELARWAQEIAAGKLSRKSGSIIILDTDGETEVARINLYECWPRKWQVGTAKSGQITEQIEFVVERVERAH